MKKILLIIQLLCILLQVYSTGQTEQHQTGQISVFVSILPQVYFVERLGGSRVVVQELVPAGREPHVYEPSPRQMASLSEADIYFTIGVSFEKVFLPKIKESMRDVTISDTSRGVVFRHFKTHQEAIHDEESDHDEIHSVEDPDDETHGDESYPDDPEHTHGIQDPHIWLGTGEVKIQLRNIVNALIEIDPDGKTLYESNYTQFITEIDILHKRTEKALKPVKGEKFFVFHPAFGYFADEYGLEQFPIEIEGKEPAARQLARIIEMVRGEEVKVIFVQPQFSQSKANTIAEHTGCVVVPIDPLKKDWLSNMEDLANKIEEGLRE